MWDCEKCGCLNIAEPLTVCPACQEEKNVPKVSSADGLATNLIDPNTGEMDGVRAPVREAEPESPAEELPAPPAQSAPKAEWVDHAVAVGVAESPEDAASSTKAELQEQVAQAQPQQFVDPAAAVPQDEPEGD